MHPGDTPPATLAARITAGHAPAFREFFNREVAGLIRYATSIIGSREGARDAARETFVRLWHFRARLDPAADPARLLYTIVRNLARDQLRDAAAELGPKRAEPILVEGGREADDPQEAMQRVLESLTRPQREIVLLRWHRHLTYEQIGVQLQIAPGTASAHMQRAMEQLKGLFPRLRAR